MAEEEKKASVWGSVASKALTLLMFLFQLISGKSQNPEITQAEKNKKVQKILDENKEIIEESHKTNNLDELRKRIAK